MDGSGASGGGLGETAGEGFGGGITDREAASGGAGWLEDELELFLKLGS